MAHDHPHHHAPEVLTSKDINQSFIFGILLNVIYVIAELWYGWREGSTALISDAVHNVGDVSGLLLAFLAFRLLRIKSGNTFTYGFKKGTILASFVNSILLVFAIGAIAWEGVQHILHPNPVNGNTIMLVAFIGVIVNFVSAYLFHKKKENDLNIKAAYWHLMADALVSLGVVVAGLVMKLTGWYYIDGVVALIIAVVILISTWSLFKDSVIGIFDGVPTAINKVEIESHLMEIDGVLDVHHTHIWSMSTSENALTAHIKVRDLNDLVCIKNKIKEELSEHNIPHSTIEFEAAEEHCPG